MESKKIINNKIAGNYILIYSLLFVITASVVFSSFYMANKSFIWQSDGFMQHFPAMYETRENLITILKSGFKEIPFWNWASGLGINLAFIYTYDIFNLFSVFIPESMLVYGYSFFIIIKMYLAGLFLIIYLKEIEIDGAGVIAGGLIYSFCGFSLYGGIRHPFFMSALVLFPLIVLGIERSLLKEKHKILITAVFLATVSHYYFLYMMGIGGAIYTFVRYNSLEIENKSYIKMSINMILRVLCGIGLGAFAILPNILLFLNSNRTSGSNSIIKIYNLSDYNCLITSFANPQTAHYWTLFMFPSIAVIVVGLIYTNIFKGFEWIRRIFIIMSIMILIPFAGSMMNGFSDVSNRWTFMYSFFVASMISIAISRIKLLEKKHFFIMAVMSVGYLVYMFLVKGRNLQFIVSPLFAILITLILIFSVKYKVNVKIINVIIIMFVIANISFIGNYYYISPTLNYRKEFVDNDGLIDKYNQPYDRFNQLKEEQEFFRTDENDYAKGDKYKSSIVSNDGLVSNINTSSQYISVLDKNSCDFYKDLAVFNRKHLNSIIGYDDRSILESLLSVKYKVIKDKDEEYLGKGYKLIDSKDGYSLYENKYSLPMGVYYSDYITEDEYDSLSENDKEFALLQGVVLSRGNQNSLNQIEPQVYTKEAKYKVKENKDILFKDNEIIVKKKNAELVLESDIPADSQLYLSFTKLKAEDGLSKNVYVSSGAQEKRIYLYGNDEMYNPHEENNLINLGYCKDKINKKQIKIKFDKEGTYSFEELKIKTVDMSHYEEYITNLNSVKLTDLKISNNSIDGNIENFKDGVVFYSVPYDKGWSAKVDNKDVDIINVNDGFIGVPIGDGKHEIHLSFCPRGLKLGIMITTITIIILGIYSYLKKKSINDKSYI